MDLDFWVGVFDRLLPRSRAFGLVIDRTFRRFFHGLGILPKTLQEHIAGLVLEAFPATTNYLADWSLFLGSPETLTAGELEDLWAEPGGQTPRYIQDLLQVYGFDVYVHEWWVPDSCPPEARNPIVLVPTSRVLVNDLTHIERKWAHQFGDGFSQFQSDNDVRFGEYDGYHWVPKIYPTPDDPREYPTYWYVCGETWPEYAEIPEEGLRTLIRLIYKLKPVHTRVILRVTLTCSGDIQDTIDSLDEWQDTVSSGDEIQDVSYTECP